MINKEARKQIEQLVARINARKEHEYAAATYLDVPDLKEIAEILEDNYEAKEDDLNFRFIVDLFLAEKYTSLGRFSIAAKYRFDALKSANFLSGYYQVSKEIKGEIEQLFTDLLRDRNFYVDDDCLDCLELIKKADLLEEKAIDKVYQYRMNRRRNLNADPVEMSPQYLAVIDEVEKRIAENRKMHGMGSCYETWNLKEIYLGEKGIKWSSPAVLNPRVMFD